MRQISSEEAAQRAVPKKKEKKRSFSQYHCMKVQCISEREMLVRTCVHTAGLSQHSSPRYRYLPPITSNIVSTPLYLLALTSSLPIRRAGAGAEAESSLWTSFNVLTATSRRLKVCRYLTSRFSRFATWPSQSDPITPILTATKDPIPIPIQPIQLPA